MLTHPVEAERQACGTQKRGRDTLSRSADTHRAGERRPLPHKANNVAHCLALFFSSPALETNA